MAVPTSVSLILSVVLALLIFSVMQIYKPVLSNSKTGTLIGGFAGSWLFIFSLTAISNLEAILFGRGFQAKVFPEVILCLIASASAAAAVHRVCLTTCIIFSLIALYFINRLSQSVYSSSVAYSETVQPKKKKNK